MKLTSIRYFLLVLCCAAMMASTAGGTLHRSPNQAADAEGAIEVELPVPESDVLQSVEEVSQDGIIHGTYVYEREKTLTGAHSLSSSGAFGSLETTGKLLYKFADNVVDPRHFKGINGLGAITVRYMVQAISPDKTKLRIDAVFTLVDRHRSDVSDGTVESAEYDAIRERLQLVQQSRSQAPPEVARREEEHVTMKAMKEVPPPVEVLRADALPELEQRVAKLRSQVEAQVKSDGTALRSAPFHRAPAIQYLPATTSVVILVLTPKWYGVESRDGHRGWILRSDFGSRP